MKGSRIFYLYLALFLGVAALSTSSIFVKLSTAPAPVIAFYRMLLSTLFIIPMLLWNKNAWKEFRSLTARQLLLFVLSGLLLAVHFILWFESLRFTSVASSTVLVTLQPLFAFIGGYFLFGEKLKGMAIMGGILAILGSIIIGVGDIKIGGMALLGDCLALLGAAVITAYFLIGQHVRKAISLSVYTFIVYLASSVFLIVYCVALQYPLTGYSGENWLLFLGLALIPTLLGHTVMNWLIRWLSTSTISMSILGEPVGTCILAYFILGEIITMEQAVGASVILFGIFLYIYSQQMAGKKELEPKGQQVINS